MTGTTARVVSAAFMTSALLVAACGSTGAPSAGAAGAGGGSVAGGGAGVPGAGVPGTGAGTPSGPVGKSLDGFDPCSVVSDSEFVQAITAEAGDPSALGTVNATHTPVDGTATGLPGAKACKLTYTTTDSAGRVNQGGDPVIVTFDAYSNLNDLKGSNPVVVSDYQSSGAEAFEGPGDAGVPHITKNGYLFRMSGNSDTALLKVIALGIAKRL